MSGEDKMMVALASVGKALCDCIYMCRRTVGGGFFSPWVRGGIGTGGAFVVV